MEKILQFGEGNFLRAFAEYFIQLANNEGENISVAITQPRTNTKTINALKSQNCRYNVYLKGRKDGSVIDDTVKIDCVSRCIDSVSEYDKLAELFTSGDLQIVISNTTEAGICFDEKNDATFPAKVTRLLYKRFKEGCTPLVFLPVELIENNGSELKKCIISYAELFGFGDAFIAFVNECSFCNTLVDRIVTGHIPDDDDPCSVACEPYASWIIDADDRAKAAISFAKYSDDIVFSNNLSSYRERKVKILNGTHTMTVPAAYMCGFDIVRDVMNDKLFSKYIDIGIEEIKATVNMPDSELDIFANSVLERFNNPFINHRLLDISLNSVSKFKTRCLPSIIDYQRIYNKNPKILTFSLAAIIAFYKQSDVVSDSDDIIVLFKNEPQLILKNEIWKADLSFIENDVISYYNSICEKGIKKAIEEVINE